MFHFDIRWDDNLFQVMVFFVCTNQIEPKRKFKMKTDVVGIDHFCMFTTVLYSIRSALLWQATFYHSLTLSLSLFLGVSGYGWYGNCSLTFDHKMRRINNTKENTFALNRSRPNVRWCMPLVPKFYFYNRFHHTI